MAENLDSVRFGGTCPYPGCIEPTGHPMAHAEGVAHFNAGPTDLIADLRAENARLQERVEEAERNLAEQKQITDSIITVDVAGLRKAWKEAEALAERRKEGDELWRRVRALVGRLSGEQDLEVFAFLVGMIGRWTELNQGARAAIEEEGT